MCRPSRLAVLSSGLIITGLSCQRSEPGPHSSPVEIQVDLAQEEIAENPDGGPTIEAEIPLVPLRTIDYSYKIKTWPSGEYWSEVLPRRPVFFDEDYWNEVRSRRPVLLFFDEVKPIEDKMSEEFAGRARGTDLASGRACSQNYRSASIQYAESVRSSRT